MVHRVSHFEQTCLLLACCCIIVCRSSVRLPWGARSKCHFVLQIAVGHGHAPGTYFLYGLLVCVNGKTQVLEDGPHHCSNEYLVR